MTDHNGQTTNEAITYIGETSLLIRFREELISKGFEDGGSVGKIRRVRIYPFSGSNDNPLIEAYGFYGCFFTEPIEVTSENIETFINNLQP